jgi:midasin
MSFLPFVRLADAFVTYDKLQRLSQRLEQLAASPEIAFYGSTIANQVSEVHTVLCKLVSALKETNQGLDTFNALQPDPRIPGPFLDEVKALEVATDTLRRQLSVICDDVKSSSLPVLLESKIYFLLIVFR